MNAVIIARIPENMASLKISIPICFSDRGFFAINNLTSVIGGIKVSVGERTFDSLLSSKFSEIQTVLEGR